MALNSHSSILDVKKLTRREIIFLIKNDEHYSGCCKIIEDRNLSGKDILELTEIQIEKWKPPRWLIRKLLSLKTSLINNPNKFLQQEEEDSPEFSNQSGSRKLSNKVESLFKPPDIQQSDTLDDFYDESNYLKPSAINSSRQRKQSHGKPPLKLPQLPTRESNFSRNKAEIPYRKPIALPRTDLEEENEYEPPPRHKRTDNDVYEPPPRVPFDQGSFQREDNSDDQVYNDLEDNTPQRKEDKVKDSDLPPPLPERTPQLKKPSSTKLIPHLKFPQYINVKRIFNQTSETTTQQTSLVPSREILNKKNQPDVWLQTKVPDTVNQSQNVISRSRSWSTTGRPLPPIPPPTIKVTDKPEIERDDDTDEEIDVEYENSTNIHVETTEEEENLPEYLNTAETNRLPEADSKPDSKPKIMPKVTPQNQIPHLLTRISEVKLRPTSHNVISSQISEVKLKPVNNPTPKKEILLDDHFAEDLKKKLLERKLGAKQENESRLSRSNDVNEQKSTKLPKPPMFIPQNIPNASFDEKEPSEVYGNESDIDEEFDDDGDLPEYLNTIENTKQSEHEADSKPEALIPSSKTQLLSQITEVKLRTTNVASQISEVKLRRTNNVTPKKEILLDDSFAEDLRKKLLERRLESRQENESHSNPTNEIIEPKIVTKLPKPPAFPQNVVNFSDVINDETDEFGQDTDEEYDNLMNLYNEKYYRNTDRKGAKLLLHDLEDGAFLLRPSTKFFISMTVKNHGKYFNLGIMKNKKQRIYCGEGRMRTPEFPTIGAFLDYFQQTPLLLQGETGSEEVYLKKVLPENRY